MRYLRLAVLTVAVFFTACDDGVSPQPEAVVSVEISTQVASLGVGDTLRLVAVARGTGGAPLTGRTVSWSSSQQGVATVSATGLLQAVAVGNATITASAGGRSASIPLVVLSPDEAVASVEITTPLPQLTVGDAVQLAAVARNVAGAELGGQTIAWSSNAESVATVSAAGLVQAVAIGTTTITASAGGRSADVAVVVQGAAPGLVASVELNVTEVEVEEGAEFQLIATPKDANGTPIAGLGLIWSNSAPDVVSLEWSGRVKGIRTGTAVVSVRVHGHTASATVAVTADYDYDLVYTMRRQDDHMEAYVLDIRDPDGEATHLFTAGRWTARPQPSPDGTRIAYTCMTDFGDAAICLTDRNGGSLQVYAAPVGQALWEPTWSPDGTRLAFVRVVPNGGSYSNGHYEVWVMNADGSGAASLTGGMPGRQRSPSWSARREDGSERIAFVQDLHFTNGNNHIWTVRPDGTDRRAVTGGAGLSDDAPSWSPEGRTLAFQRITGWPGTGIMLIDDDGANLRPLFIGAGIQYSPAWSPDGRLVAFASTHQTWGTGVNVFQVYTVRSDGSGIARRTSGDGDKFSPAWLPRP